MSDLNVTVRSLMIPMMHDKILLPNASLAEIVAYSDPVSVDKSPDWFLGLLEWRGLRVPLVSFEAIQSGSRTDVGKKSRIAIFNALGGNPELPFFAIVVQGIPHLIQANQSVVTALAEETGDEEGVMAHVLIEAEPAIIPDLDKIESIIISNKKLFV